jgi:hypothetical protein
MPTTYATAFAAHHARGSTLRPRDTTLRARDTMVHRPTMLRARDTMIHRPTMLRARDTTTTTRSTQSLGDFSFITSRHFENFPASVGWAKARSAMPTRRRKKRGLNVVTPMTFWEKPTHYDPAPTRDISAGHARSNPRSRLSQSSGLLRVSLVQSQRGHECRRATGRNAGAVSMSQDGLHGLRPGRSRCAAGLVAAYEQAAVVNVHSAALLADPLARNRYPRR